MTNDDRDDFAGTSPIPQSQESLVKDTALFRRNAVVACLLLAPLLLLISSVLQPPFVGDYVERLAGIDEAGGAAWASNVLFTVAQLPMLVAFLGIAHILRARSPRLANIGGGLGVVATFGEAVMGGTGLVYLTMASDSGNREALRRRLGGHGVVAGDDVRGRRVRAHRGDADPALDRPLPQPGRAALGAWLWSGPSWCWSSSSPTCPSTRRTPARCACSSPSPRWRGPWPRAPGRPGRLRCPGQRPTPHQLPTLRRSSLSRPADVAAVPSVELVETT